MAKTLYQKRVQQHFEVKLVDEGEFYNLMVNDMKRGVSCRCHYDKNAVGCSALAQSELQGLVIDLEDLLKLRETLPIESTFKEWMDKTSKVQEELRFSREDYLVNEVKWCMKLRDF